MKEKKMKELVYKYGFPRVSRLIVILSLIALLGFMVTAYEDLVYSEDKALQEETYQESLEEFESFFVMTIR